MKGRTVVVREYFTALFKVQKSLRNQLILEFPTLDGLRTEEVCTIRVRDLDFERGILHVLDSKKHIYMPIPLDPIVAQHSYQLIRELGLGFDDYLIQRRMKGGAQPKDPSLPITKQSIITTWWHLCDSMEIPRMSPRMGRAYFAAKWHYVEHKSLLGLMVCLRHKSLRVTQRYIEKIVSWEDVWNEFMHGREVPFERKMEDILPPYHH